MRRPESSRILLHLLRNSRLERLTRGRGDAGTRQIPAPPRRRVPASAAGVLCGLVVFAATLVVPDDGAAAVEAPRLRGLLKQAPLVVAAEVSEVTPYDNGRVAVARLRVNRVLKGTKPAADVMAVEMRDTGTPPIFRAGDYVVGFLRLAGKTTYLAQHLPAGPYYQLVSGRASCLAAPEPESSAEIAKLVGRVAEASGRPGGDPARSAPATRALVFDLIAAPHPVLVEDGAVSLATIPDLAATLTQEEQRRLDVALGRSDLPVSVRLVLIRAVADNGLRQLVPALQRIQSPELLSATLQALAKLGAAPTGDDLRQQLGSTDPQVRIAATQQLVRQEGAEAIPRVSQVALGDADPSVRIAAIEALGETKNPQALKPLERVFADPSWDIRQASARAIHEIGGRQASEAFARLAFDAPPDAQIYAVVLLMTTGVGKDDPLVQRIVQTHPDDSVRHLIEHGLDVHHH